MRVPRLALSVLLCSGLFCLGCASDAERQALDDWETLELRFQPLEEEPAPITSASTLADYVALALRRNRRLQAQGQRWRAELARVPQVRTLPEPQLSYGGFVEPIETRVGPQRHRVGLTQRLPWPGKLSAAASLALAEAEGARARTRVIERELVYQVTAAYADFFYLARDLTVSEETLQLVRHWEAVGQARFRAGASAAHADVIKAQVEIGRLEVRIASLRDARRPQVQRLAALLDLPAGTQLPWPTRLPAPPPAWEEAELDRLLAQHSPVLAELDRRVHARERGLERARQSYLPDLVLGLDYVAVGSARTSGVSGSGDDALLAKVGISLPIWVGSYAAAVSEARARLRAATLARAEAENALEASLSRALFEYRDAERKLRLYRDSLVPKAEESLEATATAFEAGTGDFLDVLDAERALLEFHLARERASADRVRARAELEMLIGVELGSAPEESR